MIRADLQITYRKGKPWAAYLAIGTGRNRAVANSRESGPVVIDFDAEGHVIGFELHTITPAGVERLKQELISHHFLEVSDQDLQPLVAA